MVFPRGFFFRALAAMFNAGLSLTRGLSVLAHGAQNEKFAEITQGVNAHLLTGKTLSSSLGPISRGVLGASRADGQSG